jgi:hypothetical protein
MSGAARHKNDVVWHDAGLGRGPWGEHPMIQFTVPVVGHTCGMIPDDIRTSPDMIGPMSSLGMFRHGRIEARPARKMKSHVTGGLVN